MINTADNIFSLHTAGTSYIFRVTPSDHLEHLYYGPRLDPVTPAAAGALVQKDFSAPGNTISYSDAYPALAPENLCLEFSSYGKGDIREPFIELVHPDGSRTCDLLFLSARVLADKQPYETLPGSYGLSPGEHLCVTLAEPLTHLFLELHYYVYEECDVICRSVKLINASDEPVRVLRLMSNMLDLPDGGYVMRTFTGAWAREMEIHDTPLYAGTHSIGSAAGSSSNRANPFFMIAKETTSHESGICMGFNLIYSGSHFGAAQVNAWGRTRIVQGINPSGFEFILDAQSALEAPEAVMTFSAGGYRGVSLNMQHFVREHIVRGAWKNRERPVLINSWEASYFRFDERSLLRLARTAADAGIELFVLDDGWFGKRNDDTSSLGDWYANTKKLPDGLIGLAKKINKLGMDFGIWVEPEMVSENSDLYRAHPDWAMRVPGRPHSYGRSQMVLDLANPAVVEYLAETLSDLFSGAGISYVKWDMNRLFSDIYSPYLPPERQGETAHRYMLGLYRLLDELTRRFPDILFEGCASGGGRFDLGMLCYFPQIWASDNTDPICRAHIQEGISYGYPLSCAGAHVSASPNHQTLRSAPLSTRFNVAAFGLLGYELDLAGLNSQELSQIRSQIDLYKKWRRVLQGGDFYIVGTGNIHIWICAAPDKSSAVGLMLQELVQPNTPHHTFRAAGLDPDASYRFRSLPAPMDIRMFSSLAGAALPVHIKQDAPIMEAAGRFITLPGETEDYIVSGALLMNAGISLTQAFPASGFSKTARCFADFASRLYFMERV